MENGVGGSMIGEQFSEIHTDLITETTINRDVKVRDHPMGRGYSTSERTIDNFIKTSHLMAAIQRKFKEKLSHMTSFSHKLVSPVSRSKYDNTIPGLTNHSQNLFYYFLEAPAQHFKSGVQIEESIVNGLFKSQTVGEERLKEFIKDQIKAPSKTKISLFDTVPRENVATGLKKEKKREKEIDLAKSKHRTKL